jgi:hypothetical protein
VQSANDDDNIKTFVVGIGIQDHTPSQAACDPLQSDINGQNPACNFAVGERCTAQSVSPSVYECNWGGGNPQDINPATKMNEIAVAGGIQTGFINATDSAGLADAIEDAALQLKSCIVPLNPAPTPFQRDKVDVFVVDPNGDPLPEVPYEQGVFSCSGLSGGWVYTDTDYDTIELCGSDCDDLKLSAEIDVQYKCSAG